MRQGRLFALLLPVVLLSISFWKAGLQDRYQEAVSLKRQANRAQSRLEELRATSVASKIDQKKYRALVQEFALLTGLDTTQGEKSVPRGEMTAQVGRLVDALTLELRSGSFSQSPDRYLNFRSVTPGERQVIEPFLFVDFELNWEGRFFALPEFLVLLSEIAEEQKCAISLGELQVVSTAEMGNAGSLSITLPLRAYFLARE